MIDSPGAEWDEFAEATPGASLAHASAWARILNECYGLAPHYLAARHDDGTLAGVLPLFHFRTLRGGRELVSVPFHDGGGVLSRSLEATEALLRAALETTRAAGASALELRQVRPQEGIPSGPGDHARINLALALESSEEAQWSAFRAKVRNQARKADKEGLRIVEGPSESLLDGFYAPFRVNMRDLGSPVHGRGLYAAAARHFGERLRFVVTAGDAGSVGGLVAIHFGERVTVTWASTLRSERRRCPNNQIYWEAMRWADLPRCQGLRLRAVGPRDRRNLPFQARLGCRGRAAGLGAPRRPTEA